VSYIKWTNPRLQLNNAKVQRQNAETTAAVSVAVVHSEIGRCLVVRASVEINFRHSLLDLAVSHSFALISLY
jgi:hypothetical protein